MTKGQKGGSEDRLFLFLRHCHADADAQGQETEF